MIRPARPDDLPLLEAIEKSAARRFIGTPMAFAVDHATTPAEVLAEACAEGRLWVAVDAGDQAQGFLFGEAIEGWFHIVELSVAFQAQGAGHGAALLVAVADSAAGLGCNRLSLTTDRDIDFNGPWYRRRGFETLAGVDAPDWLAAIPAREAATGLELARRVIMVRALA